MATAKSVLIGASSTANGNLYIQGSGSKLEVTGGPLAVGNLGMGYLAISEGGKVNVSGGGSFVSVGAGASGNGTLRIEDDGSTLSVQNGPLEVGRSGHGELQVSGKGSANVHGLAMSVADGGQSTVTIDGIGSFVQANEYADIGDRGTAVLNITGGGQLFSQEGGIGRGGDGTVTIDGNGSKWNVGMSSLDVGESSNGTLIIKNGGELSTNELTVGHDGGSSGNLILDGPNSSIHSVSLLLGIEGNASFTIRNGATYSPGFSISIGGVGAQSQGTVTVDGASSSLQSSNNSVDIGSLTGSSNNALVAQNGGKINAPISVRQGKLEIDSGGIVTASALDVGVGSDTSGDVVVQGAGSQLNVTQSIELGGFGNANLLVQSGGSVTAPGIVLRTGPPGTDSSGSIRVKGPSNLTANEIRMVSSTATLEVSGGGHVWAKSTLELGSATLQLSGGSIDVGALVGPPETNVVRVGLGGSFSCGSAVPNVHNFFGDVHVGGSPGTLNVIGNYTQDAGSDVSFSISGTNPGTDYSQLVVGGNLQLAGTLKFVFQNGFAPHSGQTFDLITVGGTSQVANTQIQFQNLSQIFTYSFAPFSGGYRLTFLSSTQYSPEVPGDWSGDGVVDIADYVVWRNYLGTRFTQFDYNTWRSHFGQSAASGAATEIGAAVPEPGALILLIVAVVAGGILVRLPR